MSQARWEDKDLLERLEGRKRICRLEQILERLKHNKIKCEEEKSLKALETSGKAISTTTEEMELKHTIWLCVNVFLQSW
jgi:hypothetical protein